MRAPAKQQSPEPHHGEGTLLTLPLTATDDSALIAGLVAARPAAVAELYDRFAGPVHRVLARALGDSRDVEDLAQDVFLVVVRRAGTLRDPAALRSFVISVAIRLARNELRKRAVRRWIGLGHAADVAAPPDRDEEGGEALRRVYAVLDRLPADERLAWILRRVEGCELTEAASACSCSLATIKRRLARAEARFELEARSDEVLCGYLGASA